MSYAEHLRALLAPLGVYDLKAPINGAALTILAFETVLGRFGSGFIALSIVLFAFSTILGWEYQGEQAFPIFPRDMAYGSTAFYMCWRCSGVQASR